MKSKLLISFVAFGMFNCTWHKEKPSNAPPIEEIMVKNELYANADILKITDKKRCDRLTFLALWDAYGRRTDDLLRLDLENDGKWARDFVACYPDHSQSENSIDGYIALAHALYQRKDLDRVRKVIDYGESHGWTMGEGPFSVTNIAHVAHLYYAIEEKLEEKSPKLLSIEGDRGIPQSFRGHILALYLHLRGELRGKLNDIEFRALKALKNGAEYDPYYSALYAKYDDGDQSNTYKLLVNNAMFPAENITEETDVYHWGSCPAVVYFRLITSLF
ncbi:hypothetical protein GF354_05835 [Candidatus Peregrinibacteria bacterium]|nr:hypothetical protein [Candidatus Peregrinibacteria bacterium]